MKHQRILTWPHQNVLRRKVRESVQFVFQEVKKKQLTVVLSSTAGRQMLPPMIIFRGKTDHAIRNLHILLSFIVKTHEKAWMDDD